MRRSRRRGKKIARKGERIQNTTHLPGISRHVCSLCGAVATGGCLVFVPSCCCRLGGVSLDNICGAFALRGLCPKSRFVGLAGHPFRGLQARLSYLPLSFLSSPKRERVCFVSSFLTFHPLALCATGCHLPLVELGRPPQRLKPRGYLSRACSWLYPGSADEVQFSWIGRDASLDRVFPYKSWKGGLKWEEMSACFQVAVRVFPAPLFPVE